MDLRPLRHFMAVADTLHFGRAAERLGMTQPPLSQSIRALEEELGAALFTRNRRAVALTPLGAQWLPHVRSALEAVEALPALATALAGGTAGRLELSFISTADYSVLPELVRRFRAAWPEVELALTEATSDAQIAALLDGQGHAGIIIPPAGAALPARLATRPLLREPLVAAVPDSWLAEGRVALDAAGCLPAAALIAAPLIVFPRRHAPAFHDLVMGYYTARGAMPHIAQQAIQMQTIISLVSAGLGLALVPDSLRQMARHGVRYVDLAEGALVLDTALVWRRDDATPTLARLLEVVETLPRPDQPG